MKKFLGVFLLAAAVILCATLLPQQTEAAGETITATEGYYTYTVTSGEATITKCDTAISGQVTIPSTLGGYPVTAIGDQAFYKCTGLTGITVPKSITQMGEGAFLQCTSLESITLPFLGKTRDSASGAQGQFGWIFGEYEISEFWGAGGPTFDWDADVPSSIKEVVITDAKIVADEAFYGCNALTSVTIPDGVTSIGSKAFYDCLKLSDVTIPDSVTSIGDKAFYNCQKLTDIRVGANNTSYCTDSQGVLYNKDKTELIVAPTNITNYVIPNTVTKIAPAAFYRCRELENITLPDRLLTIGDEAFSGCKALTAVTIPGGVSKLGSDVFSSCTNLKTVIISNGVMEIAGSAFTQCTSLVSIHIPASVTSMGTNPFLSCDSLAKIQVDENNPNYSSDSQGILYNKDKTKIIKAPDTITACVIPGTVNTIGYQSFYGCSELTVITVPVSVTRVEYGAFYFCSSLSSVHYKGTEEQWQQIDMYAYNTNFKEANRDYRYYNCEPTAHSYQTAWSKDGEGHWHACYECGEKADYAAHTWDAGVVTKQATCKETGVKTYTCTICQGTKTETIAKLTTHAYVYITGGTHKCTVCGATNTHYHVWGNNNWTTDENGHWHTCYTVPACGEKVQYAAHTPGAPATEAEPQKCTVCDYIIVPALNHIHSYAEEWTADKNQHWHACEGCEEKKDLSAHAWNDGEVTKEATEEETGVKTYTCVVCEATKEEILNQLIPAPTEPTTIPTEPTTVPTEPTTIPTEPTSTAPVTDGDQTGNDTNRTMILFIVLAAVIGGFCGGMAVFLVIKHKND